MVLIIDNTKYHHAKLHRARREGQAPDFVLDYLPPYSPALNPTEGVCKLVRRFCFQDACFAALQAVIDTIQARFAKRADCKDALRPLWAI